MEKLDTPLDTQELMLEGIKSELEGRPSTTIAVPPTEANIAAAQASIGWGAILKGRISNTWSAAQQQHLGEFLPKKNGQTWTIDIIQTILEGMSELWDLRNKDRHGGDAKTKAEAAHAEAVRELEHIYSWKGLVMPNHDWILATPLEQRKNLKTYAMKAFINCYKPILEESYKERLATG